MKRKYCALGFVGVLMLLVLSCGAGQQLDSIQVTPATGVFGAPCAGGTSCPIIQLTATGFYSHPPATKDITAQVTWKSDVPEVASINSAGTVTAGPDCGVTNITASTNAEVPNNSVITSIAATVTVDGTNTSNCPNVQP